MSQWIKVQFKLLGENLTEEGLELEVSEFSLINDEKEIDQILPLLPIEKIVLKGEKNTLTKEKWGQKFFLFFAEKNSRFRKENQELVIDSSDWNYFPLKDEFLFASEEVTKINGVWKIELAFPHYWNGQIISKIEFLANEKNQELLRILKRNQKKCFFLLKGVKFYQLLPDFAWTKRLFVLENNYQLEESLSFQPTLELQVENYQSQGNSYLIESVEDLTQVSLKDFSKIRIKLVEPVKQKNIIRFTLNDLRKILERSRGGKILEVSGDYHSFDQTPPRLFSLLEGRQLVEKIEKELKEKREKELEQEKNWVAKNFLLLESLVTDPQKVATRRGLNKEKNDLWKKLEESANIQSLIRKKFFSQEENYRQSSKIEEFKQELKKNEQEFLALTNTTRQYLKKKWLFWGQNNPLLTQLLEQNQVNLEDFLASWENDLSWKDNESAGLFSLEKLLQKKKLENQLPNKWGYFSQDLEETKYQKWNQQEITKKKADQAISLSYSSPKQWKESKYPNKDRLLVESLEELWAKNWNPPLTNSEKESTEEAESSSELVKIIEQIEEKRLFHQAQIYFQDFLKKELKKVVLTEPERASFNSLVGQIGQLEQWKELESYLKELTSQIYRKRKSQISSLAAGRRQAKAKLEKLIQSGVFSQVKRQDWLEQITQATTVAQVIEIEQKLTLEGEKTNFLAKQTGPFFSEETFQPEWAANSTEWIKSISIWLMARKNHLITWRINKHLNYYQELRERSEQDYSSQKKQLQEIKKLQEQTSFESFDSDRLESLPKLLVSLDYLVQIQNQQRKFNRTTNRSEQERILLKLQKNIQELARLRKLSEAERETQEAIEQNWFFWQKKEPTIKLHLMNEKPAKLEWLTKKLTRKIPPISKQKEEVFSEFLLIILLLLTFFGWLFYRWYRQKKEENPFW